MFPYYMTPETRQALIAESNRLIAGRRAAREARSEHDDGQTLRGPALQAEGFADTVPGGFESTFARLVADLQSAVDGMSRPQLG